MKSFLRYLLRCFYAILTGVIFHWTVQAVPLHAACLCYFKISIDALVLLTLLSPTVVNILCLICASPPASLSAQNNYWAGYSSPPSHSSASPGVVYKCLQTCVFKLMLRVDLWTGRWRSLPVTRHSTDSRLRIFFIAGRSLKCPWEHVGDYVTFLGVFLFHRACASNNTVCLDWVTGRDEKPCVYSSSHCAAPQKASKPAPSSAAELRLLYMLTQDLCLSCPTHSSHALQHRADSPQTAGSSWQRFCLFQRDCLLTLKGLSGWSNNQSMIKLIVFFFFYHLDKVRIHKDKDIFDFRTVSVPISTGVRRGLEPHMAVMWRRRRRNVSSVSSWMHVSERSQSSLWKSQSLFVLVTISSGIQCGLTVAAERKRKKKKTEFYLEIKKINC